MIRKICCLFLSIISIISCNLTAYATGVPSTYSEAYVVMDVKTGNILLEKNANKKLYPASITKILTAGIALEKGNINDNWTMSYKATHQRNLANSTHIALNEGEIVSVKSLLYTTLIESANDAANGLAEYVAGDIDNFPAIMNSKAKELGTINSNFMNANGLPDKEHYSTAYDMALITRWAISVPGFREAFGAEEYTLPPDNFKSTSFKYGTHNHMLVDSKYYYEGTEGGKLGWTEEARHTLVELVKRGDMELIVVLLKSTNKFDKYEDCIALCDYCFDNFGLCSFTKSELECEDIPITKNGKTIGYVVIEDEELAFIRPANIKKSMIEVKDNIPESYSYSDEINPSISFYGPNGDLIKEFILNYKLEDEFGNVADHVGDINKADRKVSVGTKILKIIIIIICVLLLLVLAYIGLQYYRYKERQKRLQRRKRMEAQRRKAVQEKMERMRRQKEEENL